LAETCKAAWPTLGANGDPIELLTAPAYLQLGQKEKAKEELLLGLTHHPYNYNLEYLLGQTYGQLTDYQAADQAFVRCLRLSPAFLKAHYSRALVLYQQEQYEASLQYIEQLVFPLDEQLNKLKIALEQKLR